MAEPMNTDDQDITFVPRTRQKLYDDSVKLGTIELTRDEKLELAKWHGTKSHEIVMKVWRKQRAMQIASTSINFAMTEGDMQYYRGMAAENGHIEKAITQIVNDFNRDEKAKENQAKDEKSSGKKELISTVR